MAVRKTEAFDERTARLAEAFRALGHPARVEILRLLVQRGTCICGDLVDELPLAQSTVSQHLKALKEAGLIRGTIDGPAVCYCADEDALRRINDEMSGFLSSMCCEPVDVPHQHERKRNDTHHE